MRFNRELIVKAHQMTKKMKNQYKEVDYKLQFGLCLSYLLSNKKGANEMKEFNFFKKGLEFKFKDLELTTYDDLWLKYRIVGSDDKELNNESEDKYFIGAVINLNKKIIKCEFKLHNKQLEGVSIPDDVFENLKKSCMKLINKKEKLFNDMIERIVKGEKTIKIKIVGCDYPHYQPWLEDINELKGKEQKIIEESIKKLTGESYVSNPCDYIERKLNQEISNKEMLNSKAFNLEFNEDVQKYHHFKSDIVTSFDMKLSDAIKLEQHLEKKRKIEEERRSIFEKAKLTGERQVLLEWSEPCNDPNESCDIDNIVLYAMPDGTEKQERYHTW